LKGLSNIASVTVSVVLTLVLILFLFYIGPVEVVKVDLKSNTGETTIEGNRVTFSANVNVQSEERIPIDGLAVDVDGVRCLFPATGGRSLSKDSICRGFSIKTKLPRRQ